MKRYLLKMSDFEALLTAIDRDPTHGERGGSSQCLNSEELDSYKRAHSFFNYQVRRWVDRVTQED
jgi:hypothetical protein